MPATPPLTSARVVATLRAAGCVFAEDEARLLIAAAPTPADLAAMVDRRAAGLPLEQVLGWAEFCGMRIAVAPGVFVPRRRTEFLVRLACSVIGSVIGSVTGSVTGSPSDPSEASTPVVVIDLCCGSGAIGAAIAANVPRVEVHAADIDPVAVRCARGNLAAAGGREYQGDLYEPLPATLRGRVDILVANAPYVPTASMPLLPPEAREHEPRAALDGGVDGLAIVRRMLASAPVWLAPGGRLLVEAGTDQVPLVLDAAAEHGLIPQVATSDELDATVVIAVRPSPAGAGYQASPPRQSQDRSSCARSPATGST